MNAGRDGFGGVERHVVTHARREIHGEFFEALVDQLGGGDGVRPGKLIHRHHTGGRAVVTRREVVHLSAQFNARYVAEVQDGAVGVGADDDVAEFLGRHQAALRAHRVGELLAGGCAARRRSCRRD